MILVPSPENRASYSAVRLVHVGGEIREVLKRGLGTDFKFGFYSESGIGVDGFVIEPEECFDLITKEFPHFKKM